MDRQIPLVQYVSPFSTALGPSGLKEAVASAKRKEVPSSSESKEKKKCALDEIMEVEECFFPSQTG